MRISDWSSDVCSSDLAVRPAVARQAIEKDIGGDAARREPAREFIAFLVDHDIAIAAAGREDHRRAVGLHRAEDVEPRPDDMVEHRSEEHTSELQSLMRISYAVFCLKKKTQYTDT